jgi:hypothetical protein
MDVTDDPLTEDLHPSLELCAGESRGLPDLTRLGPMKVMRDAAGSAEYYLTNARILVDREYGAGASERMPAVTAAVVTAQATEVAATLLAAVLQAGGRR